jgi:predicted AAA+ superfamily ATPase
MPHQRRRQIADLIEKKISFSRVLIIQGARQVGKSFFARTLLNQSIKDMVFKTLDNREERDFALKNPTAFVHQRPKNGTLVIDEAQRAPDIFEAVKEVVDLDQRPGQFVLLGSTEFSHRTKIRESLTGRASRAQLYPLNLAETKDKPLPKSILPKCWLKEPRFEQSELLAYLDRGGMPGIFAVRSKLERTQLWEDWIDLSLNRDLFQIKNMRPDPTLARRMLEYIASHAENSVHDIAKALGTDRRRIQRHIDALKGLFIVNSIEPSLDSTGEELYFLCDVGIAKSLGAGFDQLLRTWVSIEIQSQLTYKGHPPKQCLFTYRTEKGRRIDFIFQIPEDGVLSCIKIFPFEGLVYQDLEILRAFIKKHPHSKGYALTSQKLPTEDKSIHIIPWQAIG